MAKCNQLTSLPFKGLITYILHMWITYIETHFGLFPDSLLRHVGCTDLLSDAACFAILNVCSPQLTTITQIHNTVAVFYHIMFLTFVYVHIAYFRCSCAAFGRNKLMMMMTITLHVSDIHLVCNIHILWTATNQLPADWRGLRGRPTLTQYHWTWPMTRQPSIQPSMAVCTGPFRMMQSWSSSSVEA